MTDDLTAPILNPNDQVGFIDHHVPALPDGDYTVKLTQTVAEHDIHAERSLNFAVKGPRFSISPSDIGSQFPPPNANGQFEAVLPHIILKRSTLPWERTAVHGHEPDNPLPWLALLVFSSKELAGKTRIVSASDLVTAELHEEPQLPNGASFYPLHRESTDDLDAKVLLLDLPRDEATEMLPHLSELRLLTTVRQVQPDDHRDSNNGRAIVIANRAPVIGERNVAHLVSVEHQFASNGTHWSVAPKPDTLSLVSLAHWEFMCDASPGNLAEILNKISIEKFALPDDALAESQHKVATGAVPLVQQIRTGERTASWYHGPLISGARSGPVHQPQPLPVRHAEELLEFDGPTGMFDISLASAWKLGQMLALSNQRVAQAIHKWKRAAAHISYGREQQTRHWEHAAATADFLRFPASEWFESALGQLREVPFSYLVADPRLLPQESIVLFRLDEVWMNALYDGAFSIGRTSQRELDSDTFLWYHLPRRRAQSGVLIRSKAVANWPDLLVDPRPLTHLDQGEHLRTHPLRFERIGKDVLLVLFDSETYGVDLHLHPQAIHFGFDRVGNGLQKESQDVPYRAGKRQVVDIHTLKENLSIASPHEFAFRMVEGIPHVIFEAETR